VSLVIVEVIEVVLIAPVAWHLIHHGLKLGHQILGNVGESCRILVIVERFGEMFPDEAPNRV
jgi:hypothetical protein